MQTNYKGFRHAIEQIAFPGQLGMFKNARFAAATELGYELSSHGDKRFSALFARLKDGRTIEEAYQLDVKGYRAISNDWRAGKGKPPLSPCDTWTAYLNLWKQWALENPSLVEDLRIKAAGRTLTDKFASSPISQARALAEILNLGEEIVPNDDPAPKEQSAID